MNSLFIVLIVLALLILFASYFIVKQQTAAIIETFGKFTSVRQSGF
ncbi:MAG: SPFH domain-containing protein, partial [Polaribacter sp.]|nr:SPFH domain-containing protein [Polaribacter sp.]